ncbi:MAG: nicotinate-nucleotide--dimethylbenzimidazole phosphoribosyltransferase [Dehalococcoidia bacterium]
MSRLEQVIGRIRPLDRESMVQARARQDSLTKPQGSLGRLEELSIKLAGCQGRAMPSAERKAIIVMAGDHGVAEEGVSLYPQEVTGQMVLNFLNGGAGINVLARLAGARVVVVDMGVKSDLPSHPDLLSRRIGPGTANMARGPAMTREQALAAVETGIEIVEAEVARGLDLVAGGDMGIANTTPSSAITAVLAGVPVARAVGRGTGVRGQQLAHKIAVVEQALEVNRPDPSDALDVLARVGGFEIGGLAGVMLGAATHRVPVVVDGFISSSAALVAAGLCPIAKDYFIAAHRSAESGHRALLRHLRLRPVLDLDLRLGEGTGAALAMLLAEASVRVLREMATFADAGVSTAEGAEG